MDKNSIIKDVLVTLEQNDIAYCILRNYDFLIENRVGTNLSERSIDLVVSKRDFTRFKAIMAQLKFLQRNPHYSHSHHAFYCIENIDSVSFDVQVGGIYWNDFLYLNEKYVLANRKKNSFFYTLSTDNEYIMLIVHSLLAKRYFKPEYQQKLLILNNHIDAKYVRNRLGELFTANTVSSIMECVQSGDFRTLVQRRTAILMSFFSKSIFRLPKVLAFAVRYMHWNDFWKAYTLISVIGPDGSGKSTLVAALEQHFRSLNRKVAVVYMGRGRDTILPIAKLGRAYKKREKQKDLQAPPNLVRRTIFYNFFAIFSIFDQSLRYFFHIMPKRRTQTIVIVDRYCSDLFLMKYVPLGIKKCILHLFPKPTFTFYLYNTPEILHARRPQESIEELERQIALFQQLNNYFKPIEIKTTHQQKDFEKAMNIILHYLFKEWY